MWTKIDSAGIQFILTGKLVILPIADIKDRGANGPSKHMSFDSDEGFGLSFCSENDLDHNFGTGIVKEDRWGPIGRGFRSRVHLTLKMVSFAVQNLGY